AWGPVRNSRKRDLPINNKKHALSVAWNFRMRAEIQNGETATQIDRSPDNCARRYLPPGSSRLQANKRRAGAGSPEARCSARVSSEKRTESRRSYSASIGSLASRMFSAPARFRHSRAAQPTRLPPQMGESRQHPGLRRNGGHCEFLRRSLAYENWAPVRAIAHPNGCR